MKKEELLEIGLTDEQADKVFALNGRDIERQKSATETAREEAKALQTKLEEANGKIEEFTRMDIDGIKKAADEWKSKYESDTADLKKQLEEKDYGFTVKEAVTGMKFSSESARRAFVSDLTSKRLPLQEGKLLGLEDFVKSYRESDPDAFVPENDSKTPVAVRGTAGGMTPAGSGFAFNFTGIRPHNDNKGE